MRKGPARPANDRLLSSEVQLGAGTQNMILGSVSLKTLGPDPRFSLQFHHETLDGFAGHAPGSGFNLRNDSLDGGLKFRLGGVDTDLAGSFKEDETGLQGLGQGFGAGYSSALTRAISGTASFTGSPADWLTADDGSRRRDRPLTLQGSCSPSPQTGCALHRPCRRRRVSAPSGSGWNPLLVPGRDDAPRRARTRCTA